MDCKNKYIKDHFDFNTFYSSFWAKKQALQKMQFKRHKDNSKQTEKTGE